MVEVKQKGSVKKLLNCFIFQYKINTEMYSSKNVKKHFIMKFIYKNSESQRDHSNRFKVQKIMVEGCSNVGCNIKLLL